MLPAVTISVFLIPVSNVSIGASRQPHLGFSRLCLAACSSGAWVECCRAGRLRYHTLSVAAAGYLLPLACTVYCPGIFSFHLQDHS